MNILILGSGGREHALAWAVKQNPKCDRLIVAPGNAGIAQLAEVADINILDGASVVTFCEENAIDFVIIGPEAPLAAGVADASRAAGLLTFGPSAAAEAAADTAAASAMAASIQRRLASVSGVEVCCANAMRIEPLMAVLPDRRPGPRRRRAAHARC